jgi:hypothetical protein
MTADWTARASQQWTVPAFYNAGRPDLASDCSLRVQVQFLFPK